VVEKLQDNERLKSELNEMQSRLDAAAVTSTTTESEELRREPVIQEADVVSEKTDVPVTDTLTTTDVVNGTDCM